MRTGEGHRAHRCEETQKGVKRKEPLEECGGQEDQQTTSEKRYRVGLPAANCKLREQNALSKKFTEASQLGLRMKLWVFWVY